MNKIDLVILDIKMTERRTAKMSSQPSATLLIGQLHQIHMWCTYANNMYLKKRERSNTGRMG